MFDNIKEDERGRYVARMGKMKNSYRILAAKLEGKRSVGSPRHGWKKIDIRDVEWGRLQRIHVTWDREQQRLPLKTVTNLVFSKDGDFLLVQ
jgi:hypothetical protein